MAKKEGPKPGHNGYDPEKAKQVIDACEKLQKEIADLKADNAAKCKDKHAEIKDIIDDGACMVRMGEGAAIRNPDRPYLEG